MNMIECVKSKLRNMFNRGVFIVIIKNARFEMTAVKQEQYPNTMIPEIALVGRSNVGKSSLINCLVNRKNLARVGNTPGKTRVINFYNIDEKLFLVDLPGYGYANVSKEQKESWKGTIETYLNSRKQLKAIILLVDIRHAPSKDDKIMHEWIKAMGIPYIIVATKHDKITRSELKKKLEDIKTIFLLEEQIDIVPFSATSRQGKEDLLNKIEEITLT